MIDKGAPVLLNNVCSGIRYILVCMCVEKSLVCVIGAS